MLWGRDWLQLNEKKSMESDELILKRMESNELMSWYWKRKPTWRRDLITYNSRPRILFHFNWLVIIWKGGIYLKLDVQSQGSGRILYVTGQSGWGVLKLDNFHGRHMCIVATYILMAWQLSRLERLNGIQWSYVQIPHRPTFYSYFK